jgi:hypothetical protein
MSEEKDFMKNFAMMIPQTFMAAIGEGCYVNCENRKELQEFKDWILDENVLQLQLNEHYIDLWQMRNDMVISGGFEIHEWFNHWKENKDKKPEIRYEFYTYTTKNSESPNQPTQ